MFVETEMPFSIKRQHYSQICLEITITGAPKRIRTSDLRLRRPTLCPTELWARSNGSAPKTLHQAFDIRVNVRVSIVYKLIAGLGKDTAGGDLA